MGGNVPTTVKTIEIDGLNWAGAKLNKKIVQKKLLITIKRIFLMFKYIFDAKDNAYLILAQSKISIHTDNPVWNAGAKVCIR